MSTYKKYLFGLFLALLGVALFVGLRPQKCAAGPCLDDRIERPTYAVAGGQAVGIRELATGGESPLALKMWYPASPDADEAVATAYRYEVKLGQPLGMVTIASSASQATTDAPFDLEQGPYPLVVLSPGFAMGGLAYGWLAEHLASHGFVVLAPEHQETLNPEKFLWQAAVSRPQDILTLLSFVDEQVQAGGTLAGLVDGEQTAVIGHSYGGYTALAAAGAQIDTPSFEGHCATATSTGDPTAWLCEMLMPHLEEMAQQAGFSAVPEGLWSRPVDPRIDAIIPMAGDAYFFGEAGLALIDVPVLAIGGTLDEDTPFLWGPQPTYEQTSSDKKALLALNGAEHMIFTNPCESVRWYARPLAGEFCADTDWNRSQAHAIVAHYATAFLLSELKQDSAAAAALSPAAEHLPEVTYSAEGY